MQNLKKALPPLDPLVAFEAAARLMSFTRAAQELNLSQAAVSQQIRQLEDSLGVELFIRAHKSVKLSARGRELQHTVTATLLQLANASSEIKSTQHDTRLSLGLDQSIANMWLGPRLKRFQDQYPEIALRLVVSDNEAECMSEEIEIAILHGDGNWTGFESELFFEEEIFAVCSPELEVVRDGPLPPEMLTELALLDLDDGHWNWMNWRTWLGLNSIHQPAKNRPLQINSYPLLIEAAINGQGVALGWKTLVDAALQQGQLTKATTESVKTDLGYFLVWPENVSLSESAMLFKRWCLSELAV